MDLLQLMLSSPTHVMMTQHIRLFCLIDKSVCWVAGICCNQIKHLYILITFTQPKQSLQFMFYSSHRVIYPGFLYHPVLSPFDKLSCMWKLRCSLLSKLLTWQVCSNWDVKYYIHLEMCVCTFSSTLNFVELCKILFSDQLNISCNISVIYSQTRRCVCGRS